MTVISGNKPHLRMLGGLRLEAVEPLHQQLNQRPRLLALLAVLALAGADGATRDRLAALLWPESDAFRARNALKQSVFALRQALGEAVVITEGTSLRLNMAVLSTDIGALLDAAARGDDEVVLTLASGDFLDGVHVVAGGEFEHWAEEGRAVVRRTIRTSLEKLAGRARRAGDAGQLITVLRRQVEFTPLESEPVLQLVEALAAHGDESAALAVAAEHADRLGRELEVAPPARLIALEKRIRRDAGRRSADAILQPLQESQPERQAVVSRTPGLPRPAPRRSGRQVGIGVLALAIVMGAALVATTRRHTPDRPPGATIAVFPFAVASGDSSLLLLRERITDLLALRLQDGIAPRPLDASALRRAAGEAWEQTTAATEAVLLAAARFNNATLMVTGTMTGAPSRYIFHVRVQRVANGVVLGTSDFAGPLDSLASIVDRLASDISVIATGVPTWRLADFRTRSPEALSAYADGRHLLRAGRLDEAAKTFRSALELDATFASAALGAAEAGAFSRATDWSTAPWLVRAYTLRVRLIERDRLLFDALVRAPGTPKFAQAELDGWERVAAQLPERAEAWYELGDRLYHEGQRLGVPNWQRRARGAFSAALQRDSTLTQARAHIAELMAVEGKPDEARRFLAILPADQRQSFAIEYAQWVIAAADAAREGKVSTGMALSTLSHSALVRIVAGAQHYQLAPRDADAAIAVLRSQERVGVDHFADIALWHHWALNRADTVAALDALEELRRNEASGRQWSFAWVSADHQQVLDALFWNGSDVAGRAAATRIEGQGGVAYGAESQRPAPDRAVLALWYLARGDTARARTFIADATRPPTSVALLAAGVALLQATHSEQLRPAAMALDTLLARGPYEFGAYFAPIVLARAWRALGQPDRAVEALERRSNEWVESTAFLYPLLAEERVSALEAKNEPLARTLQHDMQMLRTSTGKGR